MSDQETDLRLIAVTDEIRRRWQEARGEADRYRAALDVPLRETILAVLRSMPSEAAPEHLAAMIESQVRAWQGLTAEDRS